MISPTQRTLGYFRRRGALAAVVERYNAFVKRPDGGSGVRMDLWGFIDVLVVEPGTLGVKALQVCRTADMATRETKIRSEKVWPKVLVWLAAQNRVLIVGWEKRGAHSKRWTMSTREISA